MDVNDVPRHELLKLPYVEPNRIPLLDRNEWLALMVYTGVFGPGTGAALVTSWWPSPTNPIVESVVTPFTTNFLDGLRRMTTNTNNARPCEKAKTQNICDLIWFGVTYLYIYIYIKHCVVFNVHSTQWNNNNSKSGKKAAEHRVGNFYGLNLMTIFSETANWKSKLSRKNQDVWSYILFMPIFCKSFASNHEFILIIIKSEISPLKKIADRFEAAYSRNLFSNIPCCNVNIILKINSIHFIHDNFFFLI